MYAYPTQKCLVIAEACCNHMGDFEIAKKMISTAKNCQADFIKFQKRNPKESVPKEWQSKPHPNPWHSFGTTYLEHREKLEFTPKQHKELKQICEDNGIDYSSSVWDLTSAKQIIELNPKYIKVPSAANTYYPLLDLLFTEYHGNIHISLGMITNKEKEQLFKYLEPYHNRIVAYHAITEYPVPFERIFLLELSKLSKIFPHIGYSGHHYGIAIDMVAYMMNVEIIERHFTLNRTWPGTDQAASLEPTGLAKLTRDLHAAYKALQFKNIEMTEIEQINRGKLKICLRK